MNPRKPAPPGAERPRDGLGRSTGSARRGPGSADGWLALAPVLWALALMALFAQFVIYLAHAAAIFGYPFDIDQGEGYDVNAGWLLVQGRPIYTDNESYPYFSSNYPPLYSLAVAAALSLSGPTLPAGRAVSLAATLALGLLIFLAARDRSNALGGLIGVGCFWLSNYVYHVTPLARVNALTALLALAGVLCVARSGRYWLLLGSALLLAALFTKPTAVDALAAALLYLWLRNRRAALVVGGALLAVGGMIAVALEVSSGGAFSLNVVRANMNPFLPGQLRDYLVNFFVLHAAVLLLASYAAIEALRTRRADALVLFFAAGLVAALGVGKWGAGESYFLSAIVASSILAGGIAGRAVLSSRRVAVAIPVLLLVQCLVSAHGLASKLAPSLPDRGLQASALAAEPTQSDLEHGYGIATRLRTEPGDGLVEDAGFVIAAGKPVVGNATHLRNLQEAGLWRGGELLADVLARRYHTVVLDAELYPESVLAAIGRRYFLYDTVPVLRATQKVFLAGTS